jgi:hypothetical protein
VVVVPRVVLSTVAAVAAVVAAGVEVVSSVAD